MESSVDEISAADLHGQVTKNSVSSLVGESFNNVDSDIPDNGAAVELSLQLAGQEQLPPFVWGSLVVLQ